MTTYIALALIFLVSLAATRTADGEIPVPPTSPPAMQKRLKRSRQKLPRRPGADYVRADSARAGAVTMDPIDFTGRVIESSDPQIHGMKPEGAQDATSQAAYRSCMGRASKRRVRSFGPMS